MHSKHITSIFYIDSLLKTLYIPQTAFDNRDVTVVASYTVIYCGVKETNLLISYQSVCTWKPGNKTD